ncbi:MAG: TlpA family protein disulfide reductase [Acidobacteria bacterium]|nr:TlpA family protein disulfide reductase [Acidobacteriota bacterium]MBK9706242.1 TlpA family protein disulfide reductase [Acidobacteriota bacterium]
MSQKSRISLMSANSLVRAIALSCIFAMLTFAAMPRMGLSDVPELPKGDGTGDTPDMFIKMVPGLAGPVVKTNEQVRLSSLRGKICILDMFWSQCPHCEEHAPHMVDYYNQYRQRGLNILGLATDTQDKVEDVKNFMRKAKITYPVGFITTEVIAYYADSKNRGVPQMVIFGQDGKMVKRLIGWNAQIEQELKQTIEQLFPAKPGNKTSGK